MARVAIEQTSTFGWERYVGTTGRIIGMKTFGASAPLKELQKNSASTRKNWWQWRRHCCNENNSFTLHVCGVPCTTMEHRLNVIGRNIAKFRQQRVLELGAITNPLRSPQM